VKLVVLVLALGLLAGCGGESRTGEPDLQKDCGLPTPDRNLDPNAIPNEALRMEGATIFRTQTRSGRSVVGLNVPHGVNDAFTYYRRAAKEAGYDVLQMDNEGFEAEIYLKAGRDLASVTIRSSVCEGAVVVYLNFPVGG
jgi:hypothetical protein